MMVNSPVQCAMLLEAVSKIPNHCHSEWSPDYFYLPAGKAGRDEMKNLVCAQVVLFFSAPLADSSLRPFGASLGMTDLHIFGLESNRMSNQITS